MLNYSVAELRFAAILTNIMESVRKIVKLEIYHVRTSLCISLLEQAYPVNTRMQKSK